MSVVKRGRGWAVAIYVGRAPDPKTGKIKERRKWYHGFESKRDARAFEAELTRRHRGAGVVPDSKLRLGEYLEEWLRDLDVAPTTARIYADTIRVHVLPEHGARRLQDFTGPAIDRLLADKRRAGLSPASVSKIYRVLRTALGRAARQGLMMRNPCEVVKPPKVPEQERQVWDPEQVKLFLGEAKRSSRYYPLYLTAITTGLRAGELAALTWDCVDLALATARVQQTFYRLAGSKRDGTRAQQLFKEPKSKKSRRSAPLFPQVVEALRALREEQVEAKRLLGAGYHDRGLVFCQADGKPLHMHNVSRRDFRQVMKRAGVPRVRFHDLRHAFASYCAAAGVPARVAQELLGHHSAEFTMRVYQHVLNGQQAEAARAVERLLFGEQNGAK